ncbi:MAG: HD domain-containing protein [Anaerolineaceae bacterium]|nr:HD domain-containing protein [Anaerolineaceae bacterium]
MIDQAELSRLTLEYGGDWGLQHSHRLLKLVAEIGRGLEFDAEVMWIAAYLHDWGAYPAWAQKDVDHSLRSKQVANEFLTTQGYPEAKKNLVLETIEFHHAPGTERSLEATLLRDADALDFLGTVGVLRNFSINPRDLRNAYNETIRRRDRSLSILALPRAQEIAAERVEDMNTLLATFEAQTQGCF